MENILCLCFSIFHHVSDSKKSPNHSTNFNFTLRPFLVLPNGPEIRTWTSPALRSSFLLPKASFPLNNLRGHHQFRYKSEKIPAKRMRILRLHIVTQHHIAAAVDLYVTLSPASDEELSTIFLVYVRSVEKEYKFLFSFGSGYSMPFQ